LRNVGRFVKYASIDTLDFNGNSTGRQCPLFPDNSLHRDRLCDRGWSFRGFHRPGRRRLVTFIDVRRRGSIFCRLHTSHGRREGHILHVCCGD
jgi:hypothetical protein